jgi:predicted nucleic acid-binding Zn ribbon protein
MEPIGDEVRLATRRFARQEPIAEIVRVWSRAVGADVARNAWPARSRRDGTLHVATSSSAWAFELTQLEPVIRTRLAQALGDESPPRLRFAPGRLPAAGREEDGAVSPPPPRPDREHRTRADRLAAGIEDESLRALVARAAAASFARESSGRRLW